MVELSIEVYCRNIMAEQESEADDPHWRYIPPHFQCLFKNDKSTALVYKLFHIRRAMSDKESGKDFGSEENHLWIRFFQQEK